MSTAVETRKEAKAKLARIALAEAEQAIMWLDYQERSALARRDYVAAAAIPDERARQQEICDRARAVLLRGGKK